MTMSTIQDFEEAAAKATQASAQADTWANGPINTTVPTDSGPVPTIAEFTRANQERANSAIDALGWVLAGDFTAGCTVTDRNQYVLVVGGAGYRWDGALPKDVAPSSSPTPIATGSWVLVGDATLRGELANSDGSELVGFQQSGTGAVARTADGKLREFVSVNDFGDGPDAFALASTESGGRVVFVTDANDDTALPADYSNTLFEFNGNRPMRLTHTSSISGTAKKALKAQFPAAHQLSIRSSFHIESQSQGSGKNGPDSADYGMTIAIHKKGYGSDNSPPAGEIDGLNIFVRQDGPKGEPSGGDNSSDASGILVNVQNVEDVGFTSAWEASTSNVERAGDTITKSVQTQIGVLDQNAVGAPSYGYVCVATRGALGDAYYAGAAVGATWNNILNAPGSMRIDAAGNYRAFSPEWTGGSWTIVRGSGADASTQITHRGTGALLLLAQDAGAIQLGTSGAIRWEVSSSGTLRPSSTYTRADVGDPNRRVSLWPKAIDLSAVGASGLRITSGSGSPEGVVSGNVGSMYLRADGGPGTALYIKESGAGSTGWVAK